MLVSRKGESKYDKSKKKQYRIEKISVLIFSYLFAKYLTTNTNLYSFFLSFAPL